MGSKSVVYVPRSKLPVDSSVVEDLLKYDGISMDIFHNRGIPLFAYYIDADVVAEEICENVAELPSDVTDVVEYLIDEERDPWKSLALHVSLLIRDLKYLSGLYSALRSVDAVIVSDSQDVGTVLPSDYKYSPADLVPLREWVDDRLGTSVNATDGARTE